ncbi:MAG: hypothetical protein IJ242_00495 [Clostridia bacterium]|nr:hypothetical protein [Clostridia bacterium]
MPNPRMKPPDMGLTEQEAAYMPVVERFKPFTLTMGEHVLKYNLFIPETTEQALPLVVFMHDMGTVSEQTDRTLKQGIGALVWADPEEQKKRPCFVLAPQYEEKSAHDDYTVGWSAEATVELIREICRRYPVDMNRIYGTGQSMGTMMLCELLIRHPHFFAGCFLTAGQWDPERMAAVKDEHLWIMVSEHDGRAFPIMGQCMESIEAAGGHVARGHVDAKADEKTKAAFCQAVLKQKADIQFTWLDKDSVLVENAPDFPAVHHMCTWKWAYLFEPVREWLFGQRLA